MTDGTGPGHAVDDDADDDAQITAEDLAFAGADDDDETVIGHASALASIRAAFEGLAGSQDVDILPTEGDERNDIAVAGDAWTLYLSGWPGLGMAFVAIEEEPEEDADPTAVEAAWRSAVPEPAIAAMVVTDLELGYALTSALIASADPLSMSLASAIRLAADR